jgi:hypothetical protein
VFAGAKQRRRLAGAKEAADHHVVSLHSSGPL